MLYRMGYVPLVGQPMLTRLVAFGRGQMRVGFFGEFRLDSCCVSRYIHQRRVNAFYKIPSNADRRFARVAQLVEQRTENPRVGGSSPPPGTTFS